MRSKKWAILIFYLYLFFSSGYLSYSTYTTGNKLWIIWTISALALGYQVIRFLIDKKNDGWNSSYVVADQRILGKIKLSLAISYVFILLFLIIGIVGIVQGFIVFEPLDLMFAAIIFSLLVFMVSQIIQNLAN